MIVDGEGGGIWAHARRLRVMRRERMGVRSPSPRRAPLGGVHPAGRSIPPARHVRRPRNTNGAEGVFPDRSEAALRGGSSLLLLVLDVLAGSDLSKTRKILGFDLRRFAVFPANGVVNFLAMDADLFGGIDPQAHLVAADVNHGNFDVVADHDRLVALTGQHQHTGLLPG